MKSGRVMHRRTRAVPLLAAALIIFSGGGAVASTCVDCHTDLKLLKELAPSKPETGKKLSHGEG